METSISTGLEALLGDYPLDGAYDEMRAPGGEVREHYHALAEMLTRMPMDELQRRKQAADLSFLTQGITFTVYGSDEGTERIFPYDLLPRIVTAAEWATIERGLTQTDYGAERVFARRVLGREDSGGQSAAQRAGV